MKIILNLFKIFIPLNYTGIPSSPQAKPHNHANVRVTYWLPYFLFINIIGIRPSTAIIAVTWKRIGTGMKPACPFDTVRMPYWLIIPHKSQEGFIWNDW